MPSSFSFTRTHARTHTHTQTYVLHTHTYIHKGLQAGKTFLLQGKECNKSKIGFKEECFEGWFKRRNVHASKLYRGQVLKAGLKEGREEPGRKRWAGPPSCLCISIDASPKDAPDSTKIYEYNAFVLCIMYDI